MKNNPDNTLEIVMDNGKTELFSIYFTFIFHDQNYVIYFHPKYPDDLYVKGYDEDTFALSEPDNDAISYAEKLIQNYEDEEADHDENVGNLEE